jgi:WD40 repeat protein
VDHQQRFIVRRIMFSDSRGYSRPLSLLVTILLAGLGSGGGAIPVAARAEQPPSEKPELALQTGHTQQVDCVAISPDGSRVLTGSGDGTAILWQTQTGRRIRTFQGHTGFFSNITALAFSPDGTQLLTGSGAQTAILWDAQTGQKLRSFAGSSTGVRAATFTPDGQRVLLGSGKEIVLWETQSGRKVRTFQGLDATVKQIMFSAATKRVLGLSDTLKGMLWDAESGERLGAIPGMCYAAALSPDGKQLATALEKTIVLWDLQAGRGIRSLPGVREPPRFLFFAADGKQVVAVSSDQSFPRQEVGPDGKPTAVLAAQQDVVCWDAATGQKVRSFKAEFGVVAALALAPDSRQLVTGHWDHKAFLWDAQTGKKIRSFQGHIVGLASVAFSPDGTRILIRSGYLDAALWDLRTGQMDRLFQRSTPTIAFSGVAFHPNGKQVLARCSLNGEMDRGIWWDIASSQKRTAFASPIAGSFAISPDGRLVLGGWGPAPAVWDVRTGQRLRSFRGHDTALFAAAFSPDGKQALTDASDRTAVLWDVQTGQGLRVFKGHTQGVASVAFRPDGLQALTGSYDGTSILWDIESGRKLQMFAGAPAVFSPDGKQVLTGSLFATGPAANLATLWETQTGRRLRSFRGHRAEVSCVAFRPDGQRILTGGGDGTARLWDGATGDELAELISLDGGREWVVVTPEGLFDGSRNGREEVAFRIQGGRDVVPLDRFFQDFYCPGLLADIGRGERPLPGKALQVSPAPLVKVLLNKDAGAATAPGEVLLDVAVTDQGSGIKGPWLRHNGAALRTPAPARRDGKTLHFRFPVGLVRGDNALEVRAATADGSRESEPAVLTVPFDGQLPDPELYAIVIGINQYARDAGVANLEFCVPDARAIAELFLHRTGKLYARVHLTALWDEKATRQGILQAVQASRPRCPREDSPCAATGMAATPARRRCAGTGWPSTSWARRWRPCRR